MALGPMRNALEIKDTMLVVLHSTSTVRLRGAPFPHVVLIAPAYPKTGYPPKMAVYPVSGIHKPLVARDS